MVIMKTGLKIFQPTKNRTGMVESFLQKRNIPICFLQKMVKFMILRAENVSHSVERIALISTGGLAKGLHGGRMNSRLMK
jgi:hypothetical protein